MNMVRFIFTLIINCLLSYFVYQTKFYTFLFEEYIWIGIILLGILIFISNLIEDTTLYQQQWQPISYLITAMNVSFIFFIVVLKLTIIINFNKPSLLKVFYDGDFNGTAIDFKVDKTYILDNAAIGISNYFYGTYHIQGHKITMDKDTIDNLDNLKYLELREIENDNGTKKWYLMQVDNNGIINEESDNSFRVIIDNRNKQ